MLKQLQQTNAWSFTKWSRVTCAVLFFALAGTFSSYAQSDDCATPTTIAVEPDGTCTPTAGTNVGATDDGVVPDPSCDAGWAGDYFDVWYEFTTGAVTTIDFTFAYTPVVFESMNIEIYNDCSTSSGILCALDNGAGGGTYTAVGLAPATTYLLRVWCNFAFEDPTPFTICLEENSASPPANDLCSNAEALTVYASGACVPTAGGTALASQEAPDPACDFGGPYPSVFYVFNSGANTSVVLNINTTDMDYTSFEIYDDCAFTPSATAAPNCQFIFGNTSTTITGLLPSTDYYISYYANLGFDVNGTFDICVEEAPAAPVNDDCSGAITVTCPSNVTGTTIGATLDTQADCLPTGFGMTGVWYYFAGTDEEITLDLCNAGTDVGYDTRIMIYTGSCGALVCEGGNDDGGDAACDIDPPFGLNFKSRATFNALLGVDYFIFVTGFSDTELGDFQMDISCAPLCTPIPGNDACASAVDLGPVTASCISTTGTTECATPTVSLSNPGCVDNFFGSYGDTWYTFVATDATHDLNVTLGTATDVTVAIYEDPIDCDPANLDFAYYGCINYGTVVPSGDPVLISGLTVGLTYYVQTMSEPGQEGDFDICVWDNPCAFVTDGLIYGITSYSVEMGWTENGTATLWDIYYGEAGIVTPPVEGVTPPTINDTPDNPHDITGLTPETTYDIWVRSDNPGVPCNSVWNYLGFVTTPGIAPGDEPSTAYALPNSGNAYPSCGTESVDFSTFTESIYGFGGPDVWYSFETAGAGGVQIRVFDTDVNALDLQVVLYDATLNVVATEDATLDDETEILNVGGLTPNATYYIGISDWWGVGGNCTICVSRLRESGCDDGPGAYDLCTNFKADYTGASSYQFNFTDPLLVTTSASAPAQVPLSSPSLLLEHGVAYDVTVNSVYNLFNGNGVPEQVIVTGSAICPITIAAHANLRTKLAQRCPATVLKGTTLQGKPYICAAVNHTITFREVGDCLGTDIGGLPFNTTTSGSSSTKKLSQVAGVQAGKWYEVTWTPNFVYGPGTPGTTDIIYVAGAAEGAVTEATDLDSAESMIEANLYPNPNNGDMVNLNITNVTSDNVFVRITDGQGRIVFSNRYTVDGSLNTIVTFNNALAAGLYNVEFTVDGEVITQRMMVQK